MANHINKAADDKLWKRKTNETEHKRNKKFQRKQFQNKNTDIYFPKTKPDVRLSAAVYVVLRHSNTVGGGG